MVATEQNYRIIGSRPVRPDGIDKVTGRAEYGADIKLSGMLYGRVKRSPHAHARILSIDTSRAEALPGVMGVLVNSDFPAADDAVAELGESVSNFKWVLDNVLAADRLADGAIWATTIAPGGATDPALVSAGGGQIRIATRNGGASYVVQAVDGSGSVVDSRAFHAVGACPR